MNIEKAIRKLAKKEEQLLLFSASKDINGIKLFKNEIDFTRLQILYLNYLYFYSDLKSDVASKKIKDYIFNDFIYEDAYMLWKKENIDEYLGLKQKGKKQKKDVFLTITDKIKFKEVDKNGK